MDKPEEILNDNEADSGMPQSLGSNQMFEKSDPL
jgi:hypothetical protein